MVNDTMQKVLYLPSLSLYSNKYSENGNLAKPSSVWAFF